MCGIFGVFGKNLLNLCKNAELISHRGLDNRGQVPDKPDTWCFIHFLHAMVGHSKQPLKHVNQYFVANCEIYNWKTLQKQHNLEGNNDAEVLFSFLRKFGLEKLDEIDGVYAFAWKNSDKLILARDIIGVKPLWYYTKDNSIIFASENKALEGKGDLVDPRKIVIFENSEVKFFEREFFPGIAITKDSEKQIVKKLCKLLIEAVKKRSDYEDNIGVLFSGGIDSVLVAKILKDLGKKVLLFTAGKENAPDIDWSIRAAKELDLPLFIADDDNIEDVIKDIKYITESDNYVNVSVSAPFYIALREAKKHKLKLVMTGLGSEELFAGYRRHMEAVDINGECRTGLINIHAHDVFRDDSLTMNFGMELRIPLLDLDLIRYSFSIPHTLKIKGDLRKYIVRKAAIELGIPEDFSMRPKKAAQYGSGYDKVITKLAKRKGVFKRDLVKSI